MRKLFVFMMVSLDGFFEGLNHDLSWHNVDEEFNEFAIKQLNETDMILFGRRTYELMASFWPSEKAKINDSIVAGLMNNTSKIVFSHTLDEAEWNNTQLIKKGIRGEIERLKSKDGKDIAIFGSSNLCLSLIQMGLIDEFRIMVNPVFLGNGTTIFDGIKDQLDLELVDTKNFDSGNVLLYYKPNKK